MATISYPLGTYDDQSQAWSPSAAFAAELNNDPASLGYKNADGSWKSSAAIGKLLCDPHGTIPNPTPQPTIPKPFAYTDLFALLSPASLANLRALPELSRVLDDINAQNRQAVSVWANLLLAGQSPQITPAEHDAIVGLMQATEPDPSWQATVPDVSRLEKVFDIGVVQHGFIFAVTGVA